MRSKIGYNIMSQSCIQGGSNGFSILSHGLQLVVELGFNDVVTRYVYPIRLPQSFLCQNQSFPEFFQLGTSSFWTDLCYVVIGFQKIDLTSNFSAKLGFFDVVGNFAYYIRLLQGFLHQNPSFPELLQLETFLLWTYLCTVAKGGRPHFEFFGLTGVF